MIVGIDASNIRAGGGLTHLVSLLVAANPHSNGINKVIVWSNQHTLDLLPSPPWLEKRTHALLNKGLGPRFIWQAFYFSAEVKQCHVLLVPGGSYIGSFKPTVVIMQNMLPFDWVEMRRYGPSSILLRLWLLHFLQKASLKKAAGHIYLTQYTKKIMQPLKSDGLPTIIAHGIHPRFFAKPRAQKAASEFCEAKPFQLLYVSIVDAYKHQWQVVRAVAALRKKGYPIVLKLIGTAYAPSLKRLHHAIKECDPNNTFVTYHGAIPHTALPAEYSAADAFIFASTCEALPIILLEAMAAGLPIAASQQGSVTEVLGDAGVYFDPENISSVSEAIEALFLDAELRSTYAERAYVAAQSYTWQKCANDTFSFIARVATCAG